MAIVARMTSAAEYDIFEASEGHLRLPSLASLSMQQHRHIADKA